MISMGQVRLEDLATGTLGAVLSYTIILVILLLTLLVSYRLFLTRRKIGYVSLMLSLLFMITQYIQLINFQLTQPAAGTTLFVALMLKTVSFLFVNLGIYQLYNSTRLRDILVFAACFALTGLVSMGYWLMPVWLKGSPEQILLAQPLGIELFLFVLIFISFLLVNPRIGQNGKYQLMLTLYFCVHMLHLANFYVFDDSQSLLTKLGEWIPAAFHIVLFLFIFERVIELMQAVYHSSIRDGLTQLYTRKYFDSRVDRHIVQQAAVSVLFSDIDDFKKLNDTKGHHMGDKILQQVSRIIMEETEEAGICARYGGEEMVVLITDSEADPGKLAERIRSRIENETAVTVSIGLSRCRKNSTADELIKRADKAMYKAKTSGKNKVVAS